MDLIGRTVTHYRITGLLGSGGMGVVYRGEDTRLQRPVAIKFVSGPAALDRDAVDRFQREARAASALSHPSICTVYDVGETEGRPFLVMEYLDGSTLAARLTHGALPVMQAIDLAISIADALDAAHTHGIVHRDIKPANVFVNVRGQAKVLDFGLAKLTAERGGPQTPDHRSMAATGGDVITSPGTTLGTVAYMSPEQARGEELDARTDIFSLGVVLYELLTGTRPFSGATSALVFNALLNHQPPPPSRVNPAVSAELDRIVLRALEKDRDLRYQSAADLRAELKRVRRDSSASTSGAVSSIAPAAPRRRVPWLAVAAGVIAVAAIGGFAAWRAQRAETPGAAGPVRLQQLTSSGRASLTALSPDGRFAAFIEQRGGDATLRLRQIASGGTVDIIPPSPLPYRGITVSPDGNYLYVVRRSDTLPGNVRVLLQMPALGGPLRQLSDHVDSAVTFSRDGARIAFLRADATTVSVIVASADGGGSRRIAQYPLAEGLRQSPLSWSPDGARLAGAAATDGIAIIDIAQGTREIFTVPGWGVIESVFWRPDGGGFFVTAEAEGGEATARHQLVDVDYPSGAVRRLTNDLNDYHRASFASDGRSIAAVQVSATAVIWVGRVDVPDAFQPINSGRADGNSGFAWLDSGAFAHADDASNGWYMNVDGTGVRPLVPNRQPVSEPRRCGPGGRVVFASPAPTGRGSIHLLDTASGSVRKVAEASGPGAQFSNCTADGRFVLYSDGGALHRIAVDGGTPERLVENAHQPEASPDGRTLAFHLVGGGTERLAIWDGRTVTPLMANAGPVPSGFLWEPDGRSLIVVVRTNGIDNLWRVPVDGSAPRQLTRFTSDQINAIDRGPDGRYAVSRGRDSTDIVLITR